MKKFQSMYQKIQITFAFIFLIVFIIAPALTIIPTQAASGSGSQTSDSNQKSDDSQKLDDSQKSDDRWPWKYEALEICQIPVDLDIGYFVELIDCHKKEIHMEQVPCNEIDLPSADFPCYYGCVTFEMRGNFDVKLLTKFHNDPIGIITDYSVSLSDTTFPGDGINKEIKLCIKAWKVKLFKYAPADNVRVGEIAICVSQKPDA